MASAVSLHGYEADTPWRRNDNGHERAIEMTSDNMNIDKALHQFCIEINGGVPISVPSRPEAWARQNYCFVNVDRKVKECGGTARFGWQFLQVPVGSTPGILTAVHHAVWESPEKELVDITPFVAKSLVCQSSYGVFFLPDDKATRPKFFGGWLCAWLLRQNHRPRPSASARWAGG